ncbi:unnamed protein product [Leptosia nina]|uniref:Peptidase S1 domain-containing protein n=1 Tax=Leptosia nina TaxID=320188 RepID=A0AAV1JGM6_9NEOP
MDIADNNTALIEGTTEDNCEFRHNFISIPWDERTRASKIGIIILLSSIFLGTMSLVIHNLVIHYKDFDPKALNSDTSIDCNLVKVDAYRYVARIRSVVNMELICVGAVLSQSSILANELCLRSGPIRLHLGSPTEPKCKKGFPVDAFEVIPHEGVITKALVILTSFEDFTKCAASIKIGGNINLQRKAYIIGRPFRGGRSLSLQLVNIAKQPANSSEVTSFQQDKVICVTDLEKCPVRAGDLLIQDGLLYGLASTSMNNRGLKNLVCFANIGVVHKEIKLLDARVA